MNKRMLIILVNYFNEIEVYNFIVNQLQKQINSRFDVLVVNNGANDLKLLKKCKLVQGDILIVDDGKNSGYLNGANLGLEYYRMTKKINPDFVILCNSDIEIEDKDFFNLLSQNEAFSFSGIIGPSIYSTLTKHFQNPMYITRPKKIKMYLLLWVYRFYPIYFCYQLSAYLKRLIKRNNTTASTKNTFPVYAVHGSFLIFTALFFEKGGSLKYDSFLYGEEMYLAEQCLKMKLEIVYTSKLKIKHEEHATSGIIKNRMHVKWLFNSTQYLYQNYFVTL
jgi:GT2 family glycosyltransferase